jgi:hypothetical protein
MSAKIPNRSDMVPNVWIQIHSSDRRLALLIVGAQKNCSSATLDYALLKIPYQRAADSTPLFIGPDDQRVKLPRMSFVMADPANPADRFTVVIDGHAGDAIGGE